MDDTWFSSRHICAGNPFVPEPLRHLDKTPGSDISGEKLQYLAKTEGIPAVVAMINDPSSDLQIEGLYPFAVTENGIHLADALNPELAGTNQLGMTNSLGMSIVREVISLAQAGGGWMYGLLEIPPANEEQYVLIYVEPIDAATYAGSLIILG